MTEEEPIDDPEQGLPEPNNQHDQVPRRHGCVTAWLILMLVANSILALMYAITAGKLERQLNIPKYLMLLLILIGAANAVFAIMLLQWKKLGFYGFAISSVAAFAINISTGVSPVRALLGLVGFAILYAVLQIKEDGTSAWEHLN